MGLDAVLFDWGDTLFHFAYDEALLEAGWEAGLQATGRDDLPDHELAASRFREGYLPLLFVPGTVEEVEYPNLIRELLSGFDIELADDELGRFLEAEHEAWSPAREMGDSTHALLESLRGRGLKLGLVSNAFDPPDLLHRDLGRMGLAERLDAAVFSSEVGRRKPDPLIFRTALDRLGVEPEQALFVGDNLAADIGGAAALGMRTVQAVWFRADDADGPEADFQAFTQMDVLNIVRRLTGEL